MSVTLLRLIPTDPYFVPDSQRRQAGQDLLAGLVQDPGTVSSLVEEQVVFVDCGQNLERISCPRCNTSLENEWWGDAMDAVHLAGFGQFAVTMPCCGESCSLNDLRYEWPMGFARYVLQAEDPGLNGLAAEHIEALEGALGCKIRIVWARY
jgi:hypothetical protein